ncbi:hypothetical protein BP6252_08271 [Coleophoma cylindrospora]|uniref:DNA repair protein Rad26 n=1 Tax=Coleophoma cylindrospora TaxID=1849047 RepID=A0A3D8R5P0_9HELO|nr:hypothetical protein BP6252_08271 [Coleophoma cylindrospora]
MAGHNAGDSLFFDDDLDDLPPNALDELERSAIQFTQGLTQVKADASSDYGDDFGDDDLDDAVVIDEARSAPAAPAYLRARPSPASQREDFRQQRYGTGSTLANRQPDHLPPHAPSLTTVSVLASRQQSRPVPTPPLFDGSQQSRSTIRNESGPTKPEGTHSFGHNSGVDSLQKQIEELLKERDALKQDLNMKAGEIAIVRSKQEKSAKEYERELTATRKLHAEQLAKQQKAIEAARNAEKSAATERDFIRQDLAEESERVRRLNRAKEAEKKAGTGPVTTPKKKKLPHRDGFDDDEIEAVSPSKLSPSKFQRRLANSPSKLGGKRKRKAADSPAALEVMHTEEPQPEPVPPRGPVWDEMMIEKLGRQDDRLDFLTNMMDHRPNRGQPRTFEEFSKYALPSSPKESLSSIMFSKIPAMGMKRSSADLPVEFCELLLSIWSKCMAEKYLKPVYLILDLLTFALELKTSSVVPHIIDTLVPLAQLTADLVAIPRFNKESPAVFEEDIDVSACLALVHFAALACMSQTEHIMRFWKLMRWDFVLLMLSQNQPVADFQSMVQILSTSVLKSSFGTISLDEKTQDIHVGYIIDRLTWPLFEIPCLPTSMDRLDTSSLLKLRLQILQLLCGIARSPYSGHALAQHQNAVGRIVSMMSEGIDALYDHKSGHEESAKLLALATHLLHHLTTTYEINMQKKLGVINGGFQKYLLCLARLNFSEEDLILEAGIDSDVAQCALEMLENAVTPDEGTAIQAAFLI